MSQGLRGWQRERHRHQGKAQRNLKLAAEECFAVRKTPTEPLQRPLNCNKPRRQCPNHKDSAPTTVRHVGWKGRPWSETHLAWILPLSFMSCVTTGMPISSSLGFLMGKTGYKNITFLWN